MKRLLALLFLFPLAAHAQVASIDTTGPESYCMGPRLNWTPIEGAEDYQVYVDGVLWTYGYRDGTSWGVGNQDAPGESHLYQVQAKVAGVWQPPGPPLVFTFDCAQFSTHPEGPQNTLLALFKFPDVPDEPMTPAAAAQIVYTDWDQWLQFTSHGHASVLRPDPLPTSYLMMPHPIGYYCAGPFLVGDGTPQYPYESLYAPCGTAMYSDAVLTLFQAGYFVPDFPVKLFAFSRVSGAYSLSAGANLFGLPPQPYLPWLRVGVIAHETGHRWSTTGHAAAWDCPNGADVGPNLLNPLEGCSVGGYTAELMSSGLDSDRHSAYNLEAMGWLPSNEAILNSAPCGTQTYTLKPLYGDIAPRELRISINGMPDWFYSLEYRPDANEYNDGGVRMWLHPHGREYRSFEFGGGNGYSDGSFLQVGYPLEPTGAQRNLTPSKPFTDTYREISVSVIGMDSESATLKVTRLERPCADARLDVR